MSEAEEAQQRIMYGDGCIVYRPHSTQSWLTYHSDAHDHAEETKVEHDGTDEEEEEAARLGGVEEAEVGGDGLADLFQVCLVAAEHAGQQHHVASEHARGDVGSREDREQADDDHQNAEAQIFI